MNLKILKTIQNQFLNKCVVKFLCFDEPHNIKFISAPGMLRVSCQDRVINDRIVEMVHEEPKLLLTVRERKLKYFSGSPLSKVITVIVLPQYLGGSLRKREYKTDLSDKTDLS